MGVFPHVLVTAVAIVAAHETGQMRVVNMSTKVMVKVVNK